MKNFKIDDDLSKIWLDLLGGINIKGSDNFISLGGDEFLFGALKKRISDFFCIDACSLDQIKHATFFHQVEFIKKELKLYEDNLVVTLKNGFELPVFIFIHPLGGTVFAYKKLVTHLQLQQKIFAIQERFLFGDFTYYDSLEQQASYYVKKIINQFGDIPYILSGHSSGGTIAFEMANQMLALNHRVNAVVMFDSWVDVPFSPNIRNGFKKVMLRQVNELRPDVFFNGKFGMDEWLDILWHRMELLLHYVPQKTALDLVFFYPEEASEYTEGLSFDRAWEKYARSVNAIQTQGNHESMLSGTNILSIAKHLNNLYKNMNEARASQII